MTAGGGDGVPSSWVVGVDIWVDGDRASALAVGGVPGAVDAGDVGVEVAHPALPVLPLEVADHVLTLPALGCGCLARVLPMGGNWVVLTVGERPWVLAGLRIEERREPEVVAVGWAGWWFPSSQVGLALRNLHLKVVICCLSLVLTAAARAGCSLSPISPVPP